MKDRISCGVREAMAGIMSGDAERMRAGYKVLMSTAVNPLASVVARVSAASVLKTRLGMTVAETKVADQNPVANNAVIFFPKPYRRAGASITAAVRCSSVLVVILAGVMFADIADALNGDGYPLDIVVSDVI